MTIFLGATVFAHFFLWPRILLVHEVLVFPVTYLVASRDVYYLETTIDSISLLMFLPKWKGEASDDVLFEYLCVLFSQIKLNDSQVTQGTGYKNLFTSVDILDWVCTSFFLIFLQVTFVRLQSKWLQ